VQGALPSEASESNEQGDNSNTPLLRNGHSDSVDQNGVDVEARETSIECHPVVQGPSHRQMSIPGATAEEISEVEVAKLKITETLKVRNVPYCLVWIALLCSGFDQLLPDYCNCCDNQR